MRIFALIPPTLLCSAIAMPAVADVTPEDVWNDTLATVKLFGQTLTADLERDGETLIARNIEFRSAEEDGFETVTTTEQLDLVNLGDGSVKMVFVSPVTSQSSFPSYGTLTEDEALAEMTSNILIKGDIIVSGDPDDLTYTVDGIDFEFLSEVSADDDLALDQTTEMAMTDVSGAWTSKRDASNIKGQFKLDADGYTFQMYQPGAEGPRTQINATMTGVASEGDYEGSTDTADMGSALEAISARFAQSFEAGTFDAKFADGDSPSSTNATGTIGHTWIDMSTLDGNVSYETSSSDLAAKLSGPAVPVEDAQFFVSKMTSNITLPMTGSDTPQPFGLGMSFEGLGVSSALWAMFDPLGELNQEPATVTVQLSGSALVSEDLTPSNPTAFAENDMPTLETLNLETLLISFAGAKIDATGAFKANEGGMATMGFPDLIGSIDATLTNVTSLIDTLTRIGLAPPEFGGMAQMMLGMLARPGSEPGVLVSHIERTEDGQILANGLPLPF
ncbi:hypothetical protein [Celeribacter sp.]|uniref:hypothetical protein n=1 Tax=Celeribacter sp. TaxID=1890673 RepID=UPI003A8E43F6